MRLAALSLLVLAMSLPLFAQTTTTYTVTGGTGRATTPTRIFFNTDAAPSQFLESGYGTECGGQTLPAYGFLLLSVPGINTCASATSQPVSSCGTINVYFVGNDNGVPFNGHLSMTSICQYRRGSGGRAGGGAGTYYTVQPGGTLTITH